MPKRTLFTNITPLPPHVSREVAIAMLHNHDEMIELNPLVIEHHRIKTPRDAPADEFLDCVWQELTDKVHYLPGGLARGKITYRACFHDSPNGLQTHIYAPMGLDIREKWTIGGTLPGEPPEARELGVNTPHSGLYLREDGDMRCNIMLTSFVRKNLDNSHKVLVERILKKAERIEEHLKTISPSTSTTNFSGTGSVGYQRGSHMAQSQFMASPGQDPSSAPFGSPEQAQSPDLSVHPAFRNDPDPQSSYRQSTYTPPSYQDVHGHQNGYPQDVKHNPYQQPLQQPPPQQYQYAHDQQNGYSHDVKHNPYQHSTPQTPPQHYQTSLQAQHPPTQRREFLAELPGSTPNHSSRVTPDQRLQRESISELSTSEAIQPQNSQRPPAIGSEEESIFSEPSQFSNQRHVYSSQRDSRPINELYAELPTSTVPKPPFQQFRDQRTGPP